MHRTRLKICGVCRPEDARVAVAAGADAIGMIFHRQSHRAIEGVEAMAVAAAAGPMVARVGVYVDARAPFVAESARTLRLELLQLHGGETHDFVRALDRFKIVKAVRVADWAAWADATLPNLAALLVDSAAGGSGVANDWDAVEAMLRQRPTRLPVILAGGLTPETVGGIVRRFRPFAVDVSSGVEARVREKSAAKIEAFARAVREADRSP